MTTRMLIDARHREETRVAVVKGHRIEEFDFESAEHKQLKGNIYLAKVTRVEPSLQAAFVEYGGNRHGFLAFSEIHPDYYQIPKEDREALLREEAEIAAADAAYRAESEIESLEGEVEDMSPPPPLDDEEYDADGAEDGDDDDTVEGDDSEEGDGEEGDADSDGDAEGNADGEGNGGNSRRAPGRRGRRRNGRSGDNRSGGGNRDRSDRDEPVDFRRSIHRRYKIQDVIRRRQVLLVQVVKEERGNKGAALTTYLSLAGRYCVLMPNSSHGGGISRKISNGADRKRLKSIIDELALPPSMGCIVRTAGLERTKTEIKRDFDYLARLWDEIREKTMTSSAPSLIHSDSDLIKRAIRDIYNSGIEEVIVEGDDGYRAAKDFMKLLMPSHARRVKHYAETVPLFQRFGAEDQLAAMYQPVVSLKSGGYIVINPTEALVSIDINSGRSTREHNIEQTALNTNLEAAYEIARQLRLRDMAGLVVIDFIDMEVNSHVRKVERAMRDALKNDRARIQVGRISGFGLMEMSRQRLRTGVLEASTRSCPHCEGTGLVRTASSAGLTALRVLEEEAARGRGSRLVLRASQEAAVYVLNHKRHELAEIEDRYGVRIEVMPDGQTEGARMSVEASGPPPVNLPRLAPIIDDDEDEDDIPAFDDEADDEEREERSARNDNREEGDGNGRRRRNRRRRRGGRDRQDETGDSEARVEGDTTEGEETSGEDAPVADEGGEGEEGDRRRRRRRGRRGGRGRREQDGAESGNAEGEVSEETGEAEEAAAVEDDGVAAEVAVEAPVDVAEAEEAPAKPKRTRTRRKKADAEAEAAPVEAAEASVAEVAAAEAVVADEAPAKPKRASRSRKKVVEAEPVEADAAAAEAVAEDAPAKPKRATRSRKKAAEPVAEVVAEVEVAAPAEAAPVAVAAPAETPTQADASAASVTSPEAGEAGGEDDTPTEKRRGWWQKTFGN